MVSVHVRKILEIVRDNTVFPVVQSAKANVLPFEKKQCSC